jgi:prepilin-type processing-associated H-X9-DG protein
LLVVIAIISLLLSVLMPSLSMAKQQARKVVCMSHQRGLMQVLQVYADSNSDVLPVVGLYDSDGDGDSWEANEMWCYTLAEQRYLASADIGDSTDNALRYSKAIWSCPSSKRGDTASGDSIKPGHGINIGMNDGLASSTQSEMPPGVGFRMPQMKDYHTSPIKLVRIKRPLETVVLADIKQSWSIYTWRFHTFSKSEPGNEGFGSYTFRHRGGSNFSFADGHVEFSEPEDQDQADYGICRPARFKYVYDNYKILSY